MALYCPKSLRFFALKLDVSLNFLDVIKMALACFSLSLLHARFNSSAGKRCAIEWKQSQTPGEFSCFLRSTSSLSRDTPARFDSPIDPACATIISLA